MKYVMWLLKAVIFFGLFAFALNNQEPVDLHFFFGSIWSAPLVLVILAVWMFGLTIGVLVMLPIWLSERRKAKYLQHRLAEVVAQATQTPPPVASFSPSNIHAI
jgi:lipopolysaccharide assembly protein A